ncbi:MAG: site-specific integrase [Terriglobales bacterium]
MKKENNGRVRFVSAEEEKKLRAAIPSDRQVELDIALNTGMRLSEQYRTEWQHVDFEHRILTVTGTKTGDTRHIPLNDAALCAFRKLEKKKTSNYVFLRVPGHGANGGTGVKSPREWFDDAVDQAGLENLTWHAPRHTFASRLVMAGVDIRTVAELMGHKTIQMTMRYCASRTGTQARRGAEARRVQSNGGEKCGNLSSSAPRGATESNSHRNSHRRESRF